MGQNVHIVGSSEALGNWKPLNSVPLVTDKGMYPMWKTKSPLIISAEVEAQKVEYKYVIKHNHNVYWETRANRILYLG